MSPTTARPTVLIGGTPPSRTGNSADTIGLPGPLARARLVYALPTNGTGPVQIGKAQVLVYPGVTDPTGGVIGSNGPVWVHRIVAASKAPETRRLG